MHVHRLPKPPVKCPACGITLTRSGGRWAYVAITRGREFSRHFLSNPPREAVRRTRPGRKHEREALLMLEGKSE